jgi:hypothetical protein
MLENAALLAINLPGTPDSYGDVATAGASAWQGRASGYLKRIRRRVVSGGEVTVVNLDVFWTRDAAGSAIAEAAGDQADATTVLIEDRRTAIPVTRRFRVVGMEHRAAGTAVDNLRLELDDERAS